MGDNAVPPMQVGYNYPWAFDAYGQNFGPVFFGPPSDGLPAWKNRVPQRLDELKGLGISIIRWFILMNGLNYGRITTDSRGQIQTIQAPTERQPVERIIKSQIGPLQVPSSGWEFDPPDQLDPLFLEHFRLMLQFIRDKRLQVIPSLVDFPFFAMPPERVKDDKGNEIIDPSRGIAPRNRNSGGGRTDIMIDLTKRKKFFETVLEPLVRASVPFEREIFAWELMNEPSWLINTITPVAKDPRLNSTHLEDFLNEGLDRIERHPEFKEKSTVGHRFHSDLKSERILKFLGGLPDGKIPQFHYYAKFFDDNEVPKPNGNKFIGEIAVGSNTLFFPAFRADQAAPWPELSLKAGGDATDTVFKRLRLLAQKGYKQVLVWPDEKDGETPDGKPRTATDRVKLSAAAQQSLRKFTLGSP